MASTKYYTILTKVGQAKIANAIVYGKRLQITQFALGDGGGASYDPNESQTALKHEVYRANVGNVVVSDETINMLEVNMAVPADVGGWIVREMGIYDAEDNLIAISKTPDDPKPGADSGAAKDVIYRLFIVVSNMDAVEIKIDPTVTVATKAEVKAVAQSVKQLNKWVAEHEAQGCFMVGDDGVKYRWGIDATGIYLEPVENPSGATTVMLNLGDNDKANYFADVEGKVKSIDNAVNHEEELTEGTYSFEIL